MLIVFVEPSAEHPSPSPLMLPRVLVTLTHVPYFATGIAVFSLDLCNTPKAFSRRCWAQVMFYLYVIYLTSAGLERDVAESSLTRPTLGLFSKLELKLCWVWSFGALISIPLLTLPGLWQRPIMWKGCPLAWDSGKNREHLREKRSWLSKVWRSLLQAQEVWLSLISPPWFLKTSLLGRSTWPLHMACLKQFSQGLCPASVCV